MNFVRAKVALRGPITFSIENAFVVNFRNGSWAQQPGLDLVTAAPPPPPPPPPSDGLGDDSNSTGGGGGGGGSGGGMPLVVVRDASLVLNYCYPASVARQGMSQVKRPAEIPGANAYTIPCDSSYVCAPGVTGPWPLAGADSAPWPLDRCFTGSSMFNDTAHYGSDLQAEGLPATGARQYLHQLVNTYVNCVYNLSQCCLEKYGPIGCLKVTLAAGGGAAVDGGGASICPPDQTQQGSHQSRAKCSPSVIAGCVVGSVLLVAVVALLAVGGVHIYRRWRRERMHQLPVSKQTSAATDGSRSVDIALAPSPPAAVDASPAAGIAAPSAGDQEGIEDDAGGGGAGDQQTAAAAATVAAAAQGPAARRSNLMSWIAAGGAFMSSGQRRRRTSLSAAVPMRQQQQRASSVAVKGVTRRSLQGTSSAGLRPSLEILPATAPTSSGVKWASATAATPPNAGCADGGGQEQQDPSFGTADGEDATGNDLSLPPAGGGVVVGGSGEMDSSSDASAVAAAAVAGGDAMAAAAALAPPPPPPPPLLPPYHAPALAPLADSGTEDFILAASEVLTNRTPFRNDLSMHVDVRVMGMPQAAAAAAGALATPPSPRPQQVEGGGVPPPTAASADDKENGGGGGGGEGSSGEVVTLLPYVLGKGHFGRVVLGRYRGEAVAVKTLHNVFGPEEAGGGAEPQKQQGTESQQEAWDTFAQEVEVLGRCAHPNVVRLLAACMQPPCFCLVMELMETSLAEMVFGAQWRRRRGGDKLLPLETVVHVAVQVASALAYLHPTIVHRDLKPHNVLIKGATDRFPTAKIADFGLSRLRLTAVPTQTPEAGTHGYMAPECYDLANDIITHQADIYSLGMLIWVMLTGQSPWKDNSVPLLAYRISVLRLRPSVRDLPPKRCPAALLLIMMHCWEHDPRRRPAAAEVLKVLLQLQGELAAVAAAAAVGAAPAGTASAAAVALAAGGGAGGGSAAAAEAAAAAAGRAKAE